MLGNYLQQTISADVIFQMHFFLGALRVRIRVHKKLMGGVGFETRFMHCIMKNHTPNIVHGRLLSDSPSILCSICYNIINLIT